MTSVTSDLLSVHLVTLGCARNEVDSEELAARLENGGFRLVDDPESADAVMVNTCGFVEAAKKDSVDTLLAAADLKGDHQPRAVVAVGCLAERYGDQLADSLPEADAVLSFDDYATVAERLQAILAGEKHTAHVPRDRRKLLPLSPNARAASVGTTAVPGHATMPAVSMPAVSTPAVSMPAVSTPAVSTPAVSTPGVSTPTGLMPGVTVRDALSPGAVVTPDLPAGVAPASGPRIFRRRLDRSATAPLKMASGCDRRCAFCAIPAFRGAYVSRPPVDIVAEAAWLAEQGVREAFLVSENSSSYGKDLGDIRLLEKLLPQLSAVDGLEWIRVSYLQPAEMRPGLVEVMASTPTVVPYFDLSFQHAAPTVLRRMRRFGDPESFLTLIASIRALAPTAGIRSNVIAGFPGETEDDVATLCDFLTDAGLDAIGVFGYSDEDGTEAASLSGQLPADEIEARRTHLADLADELVTQRAEDRVGESLVVLIETVGDADGGEEPDDAAVGRAAHQGPEVDGSTRLVGATEGVTVGSFVAATVVDSEGADLVAEVTRIESRRGA